MSSKSSKAEFCVMKTGRMKELHFVYAITFLFILNAEVTVLDDLTLRMTPFFPTFSGDYFLTSLSHSPALFAHLPASALKPKVLPTSRISCGAPSSTSHVT
jgi:hypothetical protein